MSSILKRLQAVFTSLPENLPAQYTESNYYRFLVTANYGYFSSCIIHNFFLLCAIAGSVLLLVIRRSGRGQA